MKFILIPILVIAVCQIIKLSILFAKEKKISFTKLIWEGFWVGKFPSSHSAVLASSVYLLIKYTPDKSVVGFALVVFSLFIYGLLEDKKRQRILEEYLSQSNEASLRNIIAERKLLDFSGHTVTEVIAGLIIGIIGTFLLNQFIN